MHTCAKVIIVLALEWGQIKNAVQFELQWKINRSEMSPRFVVHFYVIWRIDYTVFVLGVNAAVWLTSYIVNWFGIGMVLTKLFS